jgi:chemotaxis protein histidine kinase CheA/CheY-like chemotaxis protein
MPRARASALAFDPSHAVSDDQDKRHKRLEAFRAAVGERIAALNVAWIQIEQGTASAEATANLRGTLHTLKGEAGLFGFRDIARIAHALEDLVEHVAGQGTQPVRDVGQVVLNAFDLIEILAARPPEEGSPAVGAMLEAIARSLAPDAPEGPEPGTAPTTTPATGPGTAPATRQTGVPEPPPEPGILGGAGGTGGTGVLDPFEGPVRDTAPRSRSTYAVRVHPEQLDRMRDIIAELLLARTRLSLSAAALHEQRYGIPAGDVSFALGTGARKPTGDGGPMQSEVLRSIESQLRENVVRMSTLITALDEVSRELRMVSIAVLFDRYPVAVRKISGELGREVVLHCHGEAVEADRDVLEALDAPLLHLVHNALDHGIEPPEVRRDAGKPPVGNLTLRARIASDTLHVEVADDGAGVDIERVRRLAVERGLFDQATARSLSPHQVLQCLFLPGISTRTAVTAFSGRGVGLDVVHKTVRNLGGSVEIHSSRGVGTTFHIAVPIRAAITSVLLFQVGAGWYALPNGALAGLAEIDALTRVERIDGPAVYYEGALVPVIALEPVLGETPLAPGVASRGSRRLIMARSGDRLVALSGSHSHSQREAILGSVGSLMRDDALVGAGMGLEDGSVALVLNVDRVIEAARGHAGAAPAAIAPEHAESPAPLVLVAEDSPIVRDLIVESLRAHGLRVIEAGDGREALERLSSHPDIDLLVTDIEMPHLDGLGLIAALRARGGRRIPAIVVSTRGSNEDKLAAVEVGADAYLVKSDFSREGLWSILSRFLG